jgi:hypothetical protein
MKSLIATLMLTAFVTTANASIIREPHGSRADFIIKVHSDGEKVHFKKCSLYSKKCKTFGKHQAYSLVALNAKRAQFKRHGWGDVATFGTAAIVVGGGITILSAGTALPAMGIALTAAGGASAATFMNYLSPQMRSGKSLEKKILEGNFTIEVDDLKMFEKDLLNALDSAVNY